MYSVLDVPLSVFLQDVADFGGGKQVTVGMAMLEPHAKESTTPCLCFKAASASVESEVVGKKLHRHFKRGVSFMAVDANRPVHVANIQKHGGVYFLIPEHNREEVHSNKYILKFQVKNEWYFIILMP